MCQIGVSVVVVVAGGGASVAAMSGASLRARGRQWCGLASEPSARTLARPPTVGRDAHTSVGEVRTQWRHRGIEVYGPITVHLVIEREVRSCHPTRTCRRQAAA